jgi:hypothetical protein
MLRWPFGGDLADPLLSDLSSAMLQDQEFHEPKKYPRGHPPLKLSLTSPRRPVIL